MSSYPGALDNFRHKSAQTEMGLADAVNKIEAELGIDPAGLFATVKARLDGFSALRAVRITSNQTLANGTDTVVIYNSIVAEDDPAGDFTLDTGTGIITINNAGWYHIDAGVVWAAAAGGTRRLARIRLNTVGLATADDHGTTSASLTFVQQVSTTVKCAATDTIDVLANHAEGTPADLDIVVSGQTFLAIYRIR